ncbi:hypothetical protein QP580_11240 [Prevotella bivia]|uniref:hypothetical protein n=1 Tax=Bacteroidales TaxID=171549 RepID=UPI0005877C85|nr:MULTISPECIES: hypothetical protein [Bacteroidales]MDK7763982.1 hypothetical protein [Prevotella bivia]
MMRTKVLLGKYYVRAHLWLRHRCDGLSIRQRKIVVYGLSTIYFIGSCVMIAQFFLPHDKEELPIPKMGKLIDSPVRTDSLHRHIINLKHDYNNEFGQ